MDEKEQFTRTIGTQLGWHEQKSKEMHKVIWRNTRKKLKGGLRLTDEGFRIFTEEADIKKYEIVFPDELTITNQIMIWLDKFIESPYFISKNSIIVFSEKTAVQLMLFSGDIQKFGSAKAMNLANETIR